MIRTKKEYENTHATLENLRAGLDAQRAQFVAMGLAPTEIERGLEPMRGFIGQVEAELTQYEHWQAGRIAPAHRLDQLGQLFIALRIAQGWSQREFAERLNTSDAQVSRDEHNEYHAITLDRAQRVLDALGANVTVSVSARPASQLAQAMAEAR